MKDLDIIRERIEGASTFKSCINIYSEIINRIKYYQEIKQKPPEGFKPYWNSALEVLTKALKLANKKEEAHKVLRYASQHRDRKKFEDLRKRANKKIQSLAF